MDMWSGRQADVRSLTNNRGRVVGRVMKRVGSRKWSSCYTFDTNMKIKASTSKAKLADARDWVEQNK